jgi:hypothetical protein
VRRLLADGYDRFATVNHCRINISLCLVVQGTGALIHQYLRASERDYVCKSYMNKSTILGARYSTRAMAIRCRSPPERLSFMASPGPVRGSPAPAQDQPGPSNLCARYDNPLEETARQYRSMSTSLVPSPWQSDDG